MGNILELNQQRYQLHYGSKQSSVAYNNRDSFKNSPVFITDKILSKFALDFDMFDYPFL